MRDSKLKILIVEDSEQIRELISMTFKLKSEFDVFEAINGEDGICQFDRLNPDIVLSDIMMPGEIDGLSLCRKIKNSNHSCYVVLLSGKGQQSDIDLGVKAGADIYKVKPFNPMELIDIVNKLFA
jgi:two-component system phosphate regulon response regulator PhoB